MSLKLIEYFLLQTIRYANDVHLSVIWENTALVQLIRCEPLGEHLFHWTSAVFSQITLNKINKTIRYANDVHLSVIWENTALVQLIRCEPLGEHLFHWTCAVFSHIARKMNNVCIFAHDQVIHILDYYTLCSIYS